MPAIFSEKDKETIREKMLENGYELIKKYGFKKTTVADITRSTGLAKGTFYTFFPSKEEFVHEMILFNRNRTRQLFIDMAAEHGKLGKEAFRKYLTTVRSMDANVYAYLTEEDVSYLFSRWPEKYYVDPDEDETTGKWMLTLLDLKNEHADWHILANFMKSFSLLDMNRSMLHECAFDPLLDIYREAILDYLFNA